MPDLAMCLNRRCGNRDTCLRFLAYPNHWQHYGDFPDDGCERHIHVFEGDNVRSLEEADAAAERAENTRDLCGND